MEVYQFKDGHFEFFTAATRQSPSYVVIFRVRVDTWPEKRAREKSIAFDYLRPSSVKEIAKWMETHPGFPLVAPKYYPALVDLEGLIKQEVTFMMAEKDDVISIRDLPRDDPLRRGE